MNADVTPRQIVLEDRNDERLLVGQVFHEQLLDQAHERSDWLVAGNRLLRRSSSLDQPHREQTFELAVLLQDHPSRRVRGQAIQVFRPGSDAVVHEISLLRTLSVPSQQPVSARRF